MIQRSACNKNAPHPQKRGYGDFQCIMVAHAVYIGVSAYLRAVLPLPEVRLPPVRLGV